MIADIRFIEKDGKKILQMLVVGAPGQPTWCDVPLIQLIEPTTTAAE